MAARKSKSAFFSEESFSIYQLIYEKLLLTAFVAVISSVFLYSYNVYSRGFEAAQVQSKVVSTFSTQFRDHVIDKSSEAVTLIVDAHTSGKSRVMSDQLAARVDGIVATIRNKSRLVSTHVPKTVNLAMAISKELQSASSEFTIVWNSNSVRTFEEKISKLQANLLSESSLEVESVVLDEFKQFVSRFENEVPRFLRPLWVLSASVVVFLAGTLFILWLAHRSKKA